MICVYLCVLFQRGVFEQNLYAYTSLKRSSQAFGYPHSNPNTLPYFTGPLSFSPYPFQPSFVRFPLCPMFPLLCPATGSHFPLSFILPIGTSSDAEPPSSAPGPSYLISNLTQTQMGNQMPQGSTASLLLCPLPTLLLHAHAVPTTSLASPCLCCAHYQSCYSMPILCPLSVLLVHAHAVPTTCFAIPCLCCTHHPLAS